MPSKQHFAMACFSRAGDDNFARALENHGLLDFYALGTRRGTRGVPPEHTRLQPVFGLFNYIFARTLPVYEAESLRYRMFGLFDRWVQSLLRPGQHFFTGYAFANGAMRWTRQHGGMTFLNAWTSHPEDHWNLIAAEQKKWESSYPPASRYYQDRTVESVAAADYIFTSSTFVRQSFLKHGHDPKRLLFCPYPVDLGMFRPPAEPRPASRPFTILNTGGLSLRKGTPYLLEAFRLIRKEVPNAVLRVKRHIRNDVKHILPRYADLPLEWLGYLDLEAHIRSYQTSDLLLFPSVEDGFAYVVTEALACGLPVITTPNTGASDLIRLGENGEVVPVGDPQALAQAALKWWERIRTGERIGGYEELKSRLSFQKFEETFIGHLARLNIPSQQAHRAETSTPGK
jgi:glycosyltransferase involved in cell wall biosynthesis